MLEMLNAKNVDCKTVVFYALLSVTWMHAVFELKFWGECENGEWDIHVSGALHLPIVILEENKNCLQSS